MVEEKKMNRKGFTLIELIATIVLLGIIASISFVSIYRVIEKNKEDNCKILVNNIKAAANEYASDNRYKISNNKMDGININKTTITEEDGTSKQFDSIQFTAEKLISNKYLNASIDNPYDKGNPITSNIDITVIFNQNYTVRNVVVSNTILNKCQ